jgi:hypothetical protein
MDNVGRIFYKKNLKILEIVRNRVIFFFFVTKQSNILIFQKLKFQKEKLELSIYI